MLHGHVTKRDAGYLAVIKRNFEGRFYAKLASQQQEYPPSTAAANRSEVPVSCRCSVEVGAGGKAMTSVPIFQQAIGTHKHTQTQKQERQTRKILLESQMHYLLKHRNM
jgi:predicted nucleic acid binding AN1-type Zn finger protein